MNRKPPQVDQTKLDWAQFLGSACPRDYDLWRFTNWRWFWDYGGGTLTDLFSHWVDSVHWIMGDSVPSEVRGQGSKFLVDWFEAPDTVNVAWLYPISRSWFAARPTRVPTCAHLRRSESPRCFARALISSRSLK